MKANLAVPLLTPLIKNNLTFPNRICMAALTRMRGNLEGIPNKLHEKYYTERAIKTSFVITECSSISKEGNSLPGACGIWNNNQVKGWKNVTKSVHNVGGKIYLQIWHCGRAGHSLDLGSKPLAPSPIAIRGKIRQNLEYEVPKELTKDDLKTLLRQFHQGALNAKEAGFDGIELHGATGYLIDEFIRDATNKRTDEYGGSIENRCRFPLEVIDALIDVFGSSNVGIKLSPGGRVNDMFDSDPINNYTYLIDKLNKKKIGFIELVETPDFTKSTNHYGVNEYEQIPNVCKTFRNIFSGILIANNSFDFNKGNKIIEDGYADMVSFGKLFISNPDLVDRFENNWPLTKPNVKTFYTKGEVGYTDYPRYTPSPKF